VDSIERHGANWWSYGELHWTKMALCQINLSDLENDSEAMILQLDSRGANFFNGFNGYFFIRIQTVPATRLPNLGGKMTNSCMLTNPSGCCCVIECSWLLQIDIAGYCSWLSLATRWLLAASKQKRRKIKRWKASKEWILKYSKLLRMLFSWKILGRCSIAADSDRLSGSRCVVMLFSEL